MTEPSQPPRRRLVDAALDVAREGGWRDATLRAIATRADLTYADAYREFRSPEAIVGAILREARDAALAAPLPDAAMSTKDRIFDAAMNAFDALVPYREGFAAMVESYRSRPLAAAALARELYELARISLDRAGVSTSGAAGAARTAQMSRILVETMREFGRDDEGASLTMAALDRRLRDAERWAKRLGWREAPRPDPFATEDATAS